MQIWFAREVSQKQEVSLDKFRDEVNVQVKGPYWTSPKSKGKSLLTARDICWFPVELVNSNRVNTVLTGPNGQNQNYHFTGPSNAWCKWSIMCTGPEVSIRINEVGLHGALKEELGVVNHDLYVSSTSTKKNTFILHNYTTGFYKPFLQLSTLNGKQQQQKKGQPLDVKGIRTVKEKSREKL